MTARASTPTGLDKAGWRARLVAARRAMPAELRARRAEALAAAMLTLAAGTDGPVCAYLPVGTEPGSKVGVDGLRAAGHEVLLPVVPGGPGPLDWARYSGALVTGPFGSLREPAGERLGPAALRRARLVFVPALAADRTGVRIGKGGGYYDRTLPLAAPGVPLVVVLNDEELVDALPAEAHDHRVTAALLAEAGVTVLRGAA